MDSGCSELNESVRCGASDVAGLGPFATASQVPAAACFKKENLSSLMKKLLMVSCACR
jgi:hypothetical protein